MPSVIKLQLAGILVATVAAFCATAAHSTPFVGQVLTTPASYCPSGWAEMDGRLLAISEYEDLFTLIGTTYGGDGQTTFAVPAALPQFTATNVPVRQCISLFGIFPARP